MPADPLSPATRAAKRNLLATSILVCTYKIFDVSIKTIPLSGLEIGFEKGAFAFLLISGLIYFTITFVLYYWIDIKNTEVTPHQNSTEEIYRIKVSDFRDQYIQIMLSNVKKILPNGNSLSPYAGDISGYFRYLETFDWKTNEAIEKVTDLLFSATGIGARVALQPAERTKLLETVRSTQKEVLKDYFWKSLSLRFSLKLKLFSVRAVYIIRNFILDGVLPLLLACVALMAIYNAVNLKWILHILPKDMQQ